MEPASDQFDQQLFALSAEAYEDKLSSDGWKQLEAMLLARPEACGRWQVYMQFHSDLKTLSAISRVERSVRDVFEAHHKPLAQLPAAANGLPNPASIPQPQPRPLRRQARGWLAAIAAVIMVAVVVHWSSRPQLVGPRVLVNPAGYPVLTERHLALPFGVANYYLPGVGELIVEGPAVLQLIDAMNMRLDQGCIRIRVQEPSGQGFTVATSQGVVTDLGTEFAVGAFEDNAVNLAVFEGAVDLAVSQSDGPPALERFEAGEGVSLTHLGGRGRIMQVVTGAAPTFRRPTNPSELLTPLLVSVSDNLPMTDTKQFYEVVPGGLHEDARAYVDRPYEWNGLTNAGLPNFLLGADYVKTFNDFKRHDFEITLELAGPCKVYLLWDDRVPYPHWLTQEFQKLTALVGLDEGPFGRRSDPQATEFGIGPGNSIDRQFSLWSQEVHQPGNVVLGSLEMDSNRVSMYGIAVTP